MSKDISGHRYIERITEIIPVESSDYPEITSNNGTTTLDGFFNVAREYFIRMTDRKIFKTNDIVVYDNGAYRACNPPSNVQINSIIKNLTNEELTEFNSYLDKYFLRGEAS